MIRTIGKLFTFVYALAVLPAIAQNVTITPVGSQFIDLVKGRPVHLARSGQTMEFDGSAKCIAGCQ